MHRKSSYEEPLLASYQPIQETPGLGWGMDLATVVTQINSFVAVVWPVALTMVLASAVAVFVEDEEAARAMSRYLYYKDIDTSMASSTTKAIEAFTNALVIIAFIAAITFAVVLLYKVNCMAGLHTYLMASSATLLGLVGSVLAEKIFCELLSWHIDVISMAFVMYNFAIVGTLSIFYQKGTSADIGRGYLIVTSVIMAWQLCQLPSWSTWAILCGLAFWDLFAVLTPCGPLRCLVNLIQSEGRPMPGLLYEADIHELHKDVRPAQFPAQAAGEPAPNLGTFENQLHEFCRDYNSPNAANVHNVALHYLHRQHECWRQLYTKYNVTYIRSNRSYPSYAEVFDDRLGTVTESNRSTIKLGLGDFIFYSVLVARAAMTSFGAFAACFLGVILGLAMTMYLLGHFNALPALPLSILLGVCLFVGMSVVGNTFIEFLIMRGIC
ncbi:Presenilin-2 [Aphanomyces cochlioides]|nr:Presenilin-2 [Aphanomyces cochlioides]